MAAPKVAAAPKAAAAEPYVKSTLREYFESVCVAVILALFVRTFVVQAFKIPTGSMENNLLIGDHLLVNNFVFSPTSTGFERSLLPVGDIRRGDVIARVEASNVDDLGRLVIAKLQDVPGITRTLTCPVVHV